MRHPRPTNSPHASAARAPRPRWRPAFAAFALALISAASILSPAAADGLDTGALPRLAGAKELYASPLSTIYAAPVPVADAAAAAAKALTADGWRQYAAANANEAKNADVQVMNFKKGPLALNVLVTKSDPATTANVNYTAKPLANDLPFPPEATDIAFDPNQPLLTCASSQPIAATLAFFSGQLAGMGWSPAPAGRNANTDKAAHAYFVRPDHAPLLLVAQRGDDGTTKIELKGVTAEDLAAELAPAKPAAAAPAVAAAPPPAPTATPDEISAAVAKQVQQATADITAATTTATAPAPAPAADGPVETLGAMADAAATIPVPATAEAVKFDGAEGSLAFETASSVKSVVAFYRAAMKPLGWQAEASGIDKPNMVVLDFSKDGKDIELTVMRPIDKTEVEASGEGLVNEAEKAAAAPAPTAEDLAVEEMGGFPYPNNHTLAESEGTPLRRALTVETELDLKSVLGFYRQELAKRGWQEATGAAIADASATLNFISPDGPAVLKLERQDDKTKVSLVVSNQAKAKASGQMAKPGKVKAMFGNLLSAPVTITINKQTVKVPPGAGANGPGGPTLELPAGKYKVTMKAAGQPEASADVTVGADEIWGFMAGPGGLMPMQIH
jgi:hypothetical protein